jgi:hypothetical protein
MAQQPRQHRRRPRQFPGGGDHREISDRPHRHGLLQSAASERGCAGARPAKGHVGLPRNRNGDRACDRVRLGDRSAPADRIFFRAAGGSKSVGTGGRARRLRICCRTVRARPAAARIAGPQMAGGSGHHQDLRPRAVRRRGVGTRRARAGHVPVESLVRLSLQQYRLCQPASEPRRQGLSTSSAIARGFAKKYSDGASVQVHVNPDNPSQAVLEPRANGAWIIWVAVAIIWGLAYFIATRG